ncbi:MAG: transposase [Eubacterium sp.]|nr:transposase [Eubacterium sp.]MDD7208808.1 transposase [Lachnospiraceae bacterium]MDY5498351.1 transposase [Anaerobutyricum sp.]
MGRRIRKWYPGEILHVMNRGSNRQNIFLDEADFQYFLAMVKDIQKKYYFKIHAYCLMTNHYHLLMETKDTEIWVIMQRIDLRYACYFNTKYGRDGGVFRGRYRASEIDNDDYFLQTSRYIHLNPVKAQMVAEPSQYLWSSYRTIVGMADDKLTEITKTLKYFKNENRTLYRDFVESRVSYNQLEGRICKELGKDEWLPW